jgi:hypothetical protein
MVGGRRLQVTESLLWKDTISGPSKSSTCVLSKHIGKTGDQLYADEAYSHSSHTTSHARYDRSEAGLKAPISKGRRLVIIHASNRKLIHCTVLNTRRSQWPRGLRRRSIARSPAEIVVWNPTGWMDVCCECCVLSGRGL